VREISESTVAEGRRRCKPADWLSQNNETALAAASMLWELRLMTRPRIADAITQAVYIPTAIAYICLAIGYLRAGLALYLVFIVVGAAVGWFKRIGEWPLVSKIILACGPPLLGLGYYFSTQNFTPGMYAPGFIYAALGLVGGYALERLD
jgi:hypothetical protein